MATTKGVYSQTRVKHAVSSAEVVESAGDNRVVLLLKLEEDFVSDIGIEIGRSVDGIAVGVTNDDGVGRGGRGVHGGDRTDTSGGRSKDR